jgi:hypothetical protein
MSYIKTYDQETYEVKVEGNNIKIRTWEGQEISFDTS